MSKLHLLKLKACDIREGDRIYMHYTFPQVKSIEQIQESSGDIHIKLTLESDDNKILIRFYDYNRFVVIRR